MEGGAKEAFVFPNFSFWQLPEAEGSLIADTILRKKLKARLREIGPAARAGSRNLAEYCALLFVPTGLGKKRAAQVLPDPSPCGDIMLAL